jgi:membrane protein required for beta-lactamase induction
VGEMITPYFRHFSLSSLLITNILYGFFILLISLLVVLILKRIPLLRMSVDLGALVDAVEGLEARARKILGRFKSNDRKTSETTDVVKSDE